MGIAVFGDLSGHLEPLRAALHLLGADENRPWPEDLAVVQVGDLIRPRFATPCNCTAATRSTLSEWMRSGRAGLAVGMLSDELGPVLVTHAGLSFDAWSAIGAPRDVGEAASALNATLARPPDAFRAGVMLQRRAAPAVAAAVTWADSLSEV